MSDLTYSSMEDMQTANIVSLIQNWSEYLAKKGYEVSQFEVSPTKSPTVWRASVVFRVPTDNMQREHYLLMGDFLRASGVSTEVHYKKGEMSGKKRLIKATWPIFFPR